MNTNREKIQNFILLLVDFLSLIISYYLAGFFWLLVVKNFAFDYGVESLNQNLFSMIIGFVFVQFFYDVGNNQLTQRNNMQELGVIIKQSLLIACGVAVVEMLRRSSNFPRGVYVISIILMVIVTMIMHLIVKHFLMKKISKFDIYKDLIVTDMADAKQTVEEMVSPKYWTKSFTGIVISDSDCTGQTVGGLKVVASLDTMLEYIKKNAIDEVFLNINPEQSEMFSDILMKLEEMGVVVCIKIRVMENFKGYSTKLSTFCGMPVVAFANRFYDMKQIAVKRVLDVLGALVGLFIMGISMIFVVPAIKIESPGPIFFKQKRVGKNGRIFKIYKFRSMYMDAEERKKELMAQNEMNGLMFKMKDDPRITKVGKFIRKTSIDELPQFINVLKGDMSLVGTRPPTVDEFSQYMGHQKRRLSMKPGITGMWQAYGRKTVTDFEDIVAMDLEYIDNWSIAMDIRILIKTVFSVIGGSGQ